MGQLGHGQYDINRAGFQQPLANTGGDSGPLGARSGCCQRSAQHSLERAEKQFVRAACIPNPAMNLNLQGRIVRFDELAGMVASPRSSVREMPQSVQRLRGSADLMGGVKMKGRGSACDFIDLSAFDQRPAGSKLLLRYKHAYRGMKTPFSTE